MLKRLIKNKKGFVVQQPWQFKSVRRKSPPSTNPSILASGIDGIFSVYATYGLVHMYIDNTGLSSIVDKWYIEKSTDNINWNSVSNPKDSNGYFGFTTTYMLDHDFDYNKLYYYRLSYKPLSGSLTVTGLIYLKVPSQITDSFISETKFPNVSISQSGIYANIYTNRDKLRTTTPINYKLAFDAYLNQDAGSSSKRAYNSTLYGTDINYLGLDESTWSSTWSGLSQSRFVTLLGLTNGVVNGGAYIHYLTNDGIIKNRMLHAWRSFVSGVITHSGQYNFTLDLYEGAFGGLLVNGYDSVYSYLTQEERDTFAQMSFTYASGYKYGYPDDSNGYDLIRLGDTHSNEDTGITLRQLGSLLHGDLTSTSLRAQISGMFNGLLDAYSSHMEVLDRLYLNDESGGATPYAGEYEFNEPNRILYTAWTMYRMGYINYFTYSGWAQRAKYLAFMTLPDGRSINTGDNGFKYVNPENYNQLEGYFTDDSVLKDRVFTLYNEIENTRFDYDYTHKTIGVININQGTTEDPTSTYGLDWYGKNKGMLISRSSWDSDAVVFHVMAPRHMRYDKLSNDFGTFTLYYLGQQIPRTGLYEGAGDDHDNLYRKRTFAANTITIYQSGELFIDSTSDPGVTVGTSYSNNGDQPFKRGIYSESDYNKVDRRQGNTLYQNISSGIYDITYLRADATPAYWKYTSASNYQVLFPKKATDVTREFFFIKPSGVLIIDRIVTTSGGYLQKNIIHFEKEPTITATSSQSIVPHVGISGGIDLYHAPTSLTTEVFESGYLNIKFLESSSAYQMYKIGGIGYEYWDSASGINQVPNDYVADITGQYADTEYGRGKWRIEWMPSGITTTSGIFAMYLQPLASSQSVPSYTVNKVTNVYTNVRSYQIDQLIINTNENSYSGNHYSRYLSSTANAHLFSNLYPRTDFEFKIQNSTGTITYETISFTSPDVDYSFRDLDETSYTMTSSGCVLLIPSGNYIGTLYRYLLSPISTSSRNEVTLDSTLQSGLQLWLVGEDLNYSYDNDILLWTDRINGFVASGHVLPYTKMRNNLREGNYHKAVRFGDFNNSTNPTTRTVTASGYLQITDNSLLRMNTTYGYAVFVVHYPRITASATRQCIIDKGMSQPNSTQRQWSMQIKDGFYQTFVRNTGGTQTLASTAAISEMSIDSFILKSPAVAGTDMLLYHNGYLIEDEKLTADVQTGSTEPIRLGFTYAGATGNEGDIANYLYPYVGDVYEVLIYNSGLNSVTISGIWSYLATKYNITMSGYQA